MNHKHIFVIVFVLIFGFSLLWVFDWICPSESEKIILSAAAKELGKDSKDLSEEDFVKVESLTLEGNISDLSMLEKFTNLKGAFIVYGRSKRSRITKVMDYFKRLCRLRISSEQPVEIDLKPLSKLKNLKGLLLQGGNIKNIDTFSMLENLEVIFLGDINFKSIEPFIKMPNLRELYIQHNDILTDLEPVKRMKNLKRFSLTFCNNIQDKQVEELRISLPDISILYRSARQIKVTLVDIPVEQDSLLNPNNRKNK